MFLYMYLDEIEKENLTRCIFPNSINKDIFTTKLKNYYGENWI